VAYPSYRPELCGIEVMGEDYHGQFLKDSGHWGEKCCRGLFPSCEHDPVDQGGGLPRRLPSLLGRKTERWRGGRQNLLKLMKWVESYKKNNQHEICSD
jgi:hypothetical protein